MSFQFIIVSFLCKFFYLHIPIDIVLKELRINVLNLVLRQLSERRDSIVEVKEACSVVLTF